MITSPFGIKQDVIGEGPRGFVLGTVSRDYAVPPLSGDIRYSTSLARAYQKSYENIPGLPMSCPVRLDRDYFSFFSFFSFLFSDIFSLFIFSLFLPLAFHLSYSLQPPKKDEILRTFDNESWAPS
jgi:hypothetical protein